MTLRAILIAFLAVASLGASGQEQCAHVPHRVQCMGLQALQETMNTHIPPPEGFVHGGERDVVINVTYNNFSPEAQAAFQYAVDIWASTLTSTVPITVDAYWEPLGEGVLGFAGANNFYANFAGAEVADAFYPVALANKLAGVDLDPGNFDIEARFSSDFNWYYGTDGNPAFDEYDFVTVVLHELGHGIGVAGSCTVNGGSGSCGLSIDNTPTIYDLFVENGTSVSILNFTGTALADQLESGNLFWNGADAVAQNGGNQPEMYSPNPWEQGSSYSHFDENYFPAGNPSSLMTPFLGFQEVAHDPGPATIGLLNDIGWDIEENNGGGGDCLPVDMTIVQFPCSNDLPVFNMTFDLDGECQVEDLCFAIDGGPFSCFNLPDEGFDILDGDNLNLTNTTADAQYEIYFTTPDGVSPIFTWDNGNCLDQDGCTNPYASNFDPSALNDDGSCTYDQTICDCAGTEHTIGVLIWLGDGFADNGGTEFLWDGQAVTFNCPTWGYDCGDIGPTDDPFGVCEGNLPPNNGCESTCIATAVAASQGECLDDGDGLLPTFELAFSIQGGCEVQELCYQENGGGYVCLDAQNDGVVIVDGDVIDFINATPMATYDFYFTTTDGSTSPITTITAGVCEIPVEGCTDQTACNYNPEAAVDDGSCEYLSCAGCTNQNACNYDSEATIDDGSCEFETCAGCTNPNACNFDPNATLDDESCEFETCAGCTNENACNFDPQATIDDGSCEFDSCAGCTDPEACNFDPIATLDNGSCEFESCAGCTEPGACNFDPTATLDDGSCEFESCAGCTDPEALNYDPNATIDDGSCFYTEILGCTDPTACNFDQSANTDDGSCEFESCVGCTDPTACNYDETATIDDGSCDFESCAGCTDPEALNYDADATIDDGSCVYDCVYPTITWTTFCDEENEDIFFIEMDLDDLGNGAPYEVTNNIDDEAYEISFVAAVELGPFDNGEQVLVTVQSVEFPNCIITSPLLTDNCTGDFVGSLARRPLVVFPNPNDGKWNVQLPAAGQWELSVFNPQGQRLGLTQSNGTSLTWDLRDTLLPGSYVIRAFNGSSVHTARIVVH